MKVNTPDNTGCQNCHELESTECIVEEQSLPSLGLAAGSRLNIILKYLDKKIKDFVAKFKKVIYNVEPIFDTGIPIFNYTDESCGTDILNLNVPLFLNGRECFEYEVDNTVTYTTESAYLLFFNHTRSGGVLIEDDDTIQITEISGVVLGVPIIVKNPGETTFTFTNTLLQTILTAVNSATTSNFTDLVTDTTYTVNEDVGLGLVPSANASAAFLADLTFKYDILDVSLVLKETVIETITSVNTSGVGITNIAIESFSVTSSMGILTFFDDVGVEITDETEINNLITLIVDGDVTPVCCSDCGGAGSTNIVVRDEGSLLTSEVSSFNFVGEAIEVTNIGDAVTVNVSVFKDFTIVHPRTIITQNEIQGVDSNLYSDIFPVEIDRIAFIEDVVVTIETAPVGSTGFTFKTFNALGVPLGTAGSITISDSTSSSFISKFGFSWTTLGVGQHEVVLKFTPDPLTGIASKLITVNLNITTVPSGVNGLIYEGESIGDVDYVLTTVPTDIPGLSYVATETAVYQVRFDVRAELTGATDGNYFLQKNGVNIINGALVNKSDNAATSISIQNDSIIVRVSLLVGDTLTVKADVPVTDASNLQTAKFSKLFLNKET